MFQILMIGTQNNLYFVDTFGIEVKDSTASLLKKIEGEKLLSSKLDVTITSHYK